MSDTVEVMCCWCGRMMRVDKDTYERDKTALPVQPPYKCERCGEKGSE
jgi:hypothetical protein